MISGISSRINWGFSLFCLFFLLAGKGAIAQDNTHSLPDSVINADSTREIRIVVVPFNPAMYFSDADKDIAEVSDIPRGQVNNRMSSSLEATLTEQFGLYYDASGISKSKDAAEDLDIIYGSIQYNPQTLEKPREKKDTKGLQGLKSRLKNKDQSTENTASDAAETYMDIAFGDKKLLEDMSAKYKADYFIFINQFEIITDYENCIDLQNRKYYREIRVHYSVFSKDGTRVGGTCIILPYNSSENNISVIVRDNFGSLSRTLLEQVYTKQ